MDFFLPCYLNPYNTHWKYAKDIVLFLQQNPEMNLTHRKLYSIFSLYEKWLMYAGNYRSEPFEKQVLHYISKRVFWSDFKDGEYIAKLLLFLYRTDNHFGFFLCPDIESFTDCECLEDSYRPFHFFLYYAYRQKLTINDNRIADLAVFYKSGWLHPCEMALASESPALLQLLLQYGAMITNRRPSSMKGFGDGLEMSNALVMMLSIIKAIIKDSHKNTRNKEMTHENSRYSDFIRCGRLIIRTIPHLEKLMIDEAGINISGFSSLDAALAMVTSEGLTELRHRVKTPVPLKHACRLKIRYILHENWQLPFGIDKLSLPNELKEYLNLYLD